MVGYGIHAPHKESLASIHEYVTTLKENQLPTKVHMLCMSTWETAKYRYTNRKLILTK